jgi:uncharacterized protein involved in outer membrane biogenesis
MSKRKKILLIGLASTIALLIFIIAILPFIVRSRAVSAIEQETGRKGHIEKVAINPFTLTVTVKGLAIEAKEGSPLVSIDTLRASLGLVSIYRRALILSQVSIDAPAITFSRLAANSYSFNDILERLKAKPQSKNKLHFSINNISITNGSLDFDDQAVPGGRKHTIRNLKVAVPFISNIPYLVEKYTDPHISALVNGAPFSFNGKIKPLSKSMETSVHIDLKQLSLPEYVAYSPVKPPADLVSGKLGIDCEVTYRVSKDKKPELGIKGNIVLDSIAVNLRGGQPLLKLPSLQLTASDLEVFAKKFLFDSITVEGMELFASRNDKGIWMHAQLLPPVSEEIKNGPADVKKPEEKLQGPLPLVQVASFSLKDGTIHYNDALPPGGFKGSANQIDVAVTNFTTESGKSADYELSMLLDKETSLNIDGRFSLSPVLTVTLSSELSDLRLQKRWPYLAQWLTAPVKGTVDLACETTYSKIDGLTVTDGKLLVSGLATRYGDNEGFDLARFEVNGLGYNQKNNVLEAAEIRLSKGNISFSREENKSISILSLLKKNQHTSTLPATKPDLPMIAAAKSAAASVEPNSNAARAFSFRFKKLQVEKFNAAFTDKSLDEKPHFTLSNTSLSLSNLNGPKFTPAGLRFSSTFNKSTPLKASGDITPLPFRYKGSITIGRLSLRDFEDYFPSNINVDILSGFADSDMNVDVALKDGKAVGSFKGNAGVRSFHAIDTEAEEDLLKWESLQLDEVQGNLEPFSLSLRQIALNGVYSRIIIREDGTLNLQNLVEKPKNDNVPSPQPRPDSSGTPSADVPANSARKQIKIEAVTIQDGTLSFTDNHLPRHFTTTFHNLGGRISGLSSEDTKLADVDLRGNLENHSPLQITGQVNPLRDDLFVDLKVAFRDIELSPVTPYTGRFLGYTVEKGKLYLDLKYHIDKKQLSSENKIFIDQFTFGEKVESDKATKLPVKLGLALLKDRKGEIHLDVPVTGRTDDPKFSIWKLVFQVLQNILVKAVTSPFSLLSSMVGGGQDFSAIQFNPGTSILQPQEEQKLTALSKALLDRPALKMELKGYVDREKDTEGYRRELLNTKLRNEKFLTLSKERGLKEGEKVDLIQVLPEEQARYLAAVYKKEKFPKPRNAFGLVKDLPADEMKKLIITNTVVGETELQTLARERVVAVMAYLVTKGSVPAERIFQKSDDVFKAPEKVENARSRVELNAIAQ